MASDFTYVIPGCIIPGGGESFFFLAAPAASMDGNCSATYSISKQTTINVVKFNFYLNSVSFN